MTTESKSKNKSIKAIFAKAYIKVALVLLLLFISLNSSIIHINENNNNERRLALVAPFHFQLFEQGITGKVEVSPLLTIYDQYGLLPAALKQKLSPYFTGIVSYQIDHDTEYVVLAQQITRNGEMNTVYAVENPAIVEWDEDDFRLFEVGLFVTGLILLFFFSFVIRHESEKISRPFIQLANQLKTDSEDKFESIELDNLTSIELEQTLAALNDYRRRINDLVSREKSFTRYVSHEYRTPMTVIKGALSVLRKQGNSKTDKQVRRIHQAILQMEELIETFLLLARSERRTYECSIVNSEFVELLYSNAEAKLLANNTRLKIELSEPFELKAEAQLTLAACQNIINNAINSAIGGDVVVSIEPTKISVTDNGVGLADKARGDEGFGIGLILVKDICAKYYWQFTLEENTDENGCTAVIQFN